MFTYCFVDNYGFKTPVDFAYNRDMEYLQSLVEKGEYRELIIIERFF